MDNLHLIVEGLTMICIKLKLTFRIWDQNIKSITFHDRTIGNIFFLSLPISIINLGMNQQKHQNRFKIEMCPSYCGVEIDKEQS
jgi:hypothetical protein